ncbi:MAG: TonB family protein, partial [Candidatus Marithrix sp.]|nr:TonB family protein [Candidatus Marithrix sp.]
NLALIPLPIIKSKTRHKAVKKVKRKKLKKVRTKQKSRPSKSKTIKVKSKPIKVKPKPQIAKPASIVKKVKPKPQITKPAPVKKVKQIKKIIPKINKAKEAERNYRKKLNRLIAQKKTYPRKAKRMGQQGVVRVSFVVLNNGKIRNIKITKSSGSRSLDKAAKKLIQKISGLLPFSKSIKRKQWQFHININYRLNS